MYNDFQNLFKSELKNVKNTEVTLKITLHIKAMFFYVKIMYCLHLKIFTHEMGHSKGPVYFFHIQKQNKLTYYLHKP